MPKPKTPQNQAETRLDPPGRPHGDPVSEAALLAGMASVMAAGGFAGFAREVWAETLTEVSRRTRAGEYATEDDAVAALREVMIEITMRRMQPDIDRAELDMNRRLDLLCRSMTLDELLDETDRQVAEFEQLHEQRGEAIARYIGEAFA